MGLLVNGKWQDQWYESQAGEFVREDAMFRNWVTADGGAGPSGKAGFKAESGRYHLFVSLACPWAHRTLIFRSLKQLAAHIEVTVVDAKMLEHGWEITDNPEQLGLGNIHFMHQIYTAAKSDYTGRVTVPVLWDKQQNTIVSNESADIIRMFNSAFNHITGDSQDYYPEALRPAIDSINDEVYANINNGVYRAGFATSQEAYNKAFDRLFSSLDTLENLLDSQAYLAGAQITEADWRLFTTLIRFDAVYYGHFKTNLRSIESYPNLSNYLRELYQVEGVSETVNFEHIKTHYYYSHDMINPTRVIPKGPALDFMQAHNRAEKFKY